jgi:diguanylate cyclase (GGDEF)-like protein
VLEELAMLAARPVQDEGLPSRPTDHRRLQNLWRLFSILTQAQASFIAGQEYRQVLTTLLSKVATLTGTCFALLGEIKSNANGVADVEVTVVKPKCQPANRSDANARLTDTETADCIEAARAWIDLYLNKDVGEASSHSLTILKGTLALPLLSSQKLIGMIGLGPVDTGLYDELVEFLSPVQVAVAGFLIAARDRLSRVNAERRLQSALESQPNAFALFDADDRMITHNKRYIEMFPFLVSMGDLRGKAFYDMVTIQSGERSWVPNPTVYLQERMARHRAADGKAFDAPMKATGGWVRVRETRTPDGGIVSTWDDISELKALEQRLLGAVSNLVAGFVLLDKELRIVICNEPFREMHPLSAHLLNPGALFEDFLYHGATHGQFPDVSNVGAFVGGMLATFRAQDPYRAELVNGSERWALVCNRGTADGGGVGIWTDLTAQKLRESELRGAQQRLEQQRQELTNLATALAVQAHTDRLTGLPNRSAFEENLLAAFEEVKGQSRAHFLLFLDLDQFKIVNDACGHPAGDRLLCEASALIRSRLRGKDFLARLGGDEFAIVLRDTTESEAIAMAENLCQVIQNYRFSIVGKIFAIGLSIGMAPITADLTSVLAQADAACYVAKDSGGGRLHAFRHNDQELTRSRELFSWAPRIRNALREDRFQVWLQQIVDHDGAIRGHEALVRMTAEDGSVLFPGAFMPAAKRFNLMIKIDQWVCSAIVRLLSMAKPSADIAPTYISVNLSAKSVSDPVFRDWLLATVDHVSSVSGRLRIEITETDELQWTAPVAEFFGQLRHRGIKLYLDDFGSGYNSFEMIKKLPVDGLKIDWTVTRDILDDAVDLALVKASVSIAASLDLELIAEGVESDTIFNALRKLGVHSFQGYYFHRGEPFETALKRVLDERQQPPQAPKQHHIV